MVTDDHVSRGDIFLGAFNPTRGSEISNTRPCVVVSPDVLDAYLRTFLLPRLQLAAIHTRFVSVAGLRVKMVMLLLIS
jgi:mRNA-degrading endonuclease toxin of MazEF toxin-antitoxin module